MFFGNVFTGIFCFSIRRSLFLYMDVCVLICLCYRIDFFDDTFSKGKNFARIFFDLISNHIIPLLNSMSNSIRHILHNEKKMVGIVSLPCLGIATVYQYPVL